MEKAELRQLVREAKKRLSDDEKRESAQIIGARIEAQPCFAAARRILLYHSLSDEVDTHAWLARWQHLKELYLPVVEGSNLVVRRYRQEELSVGSFGICEPAGENLDDLSRIDLVIVPGMAFDSRRNRLGRGKGFYDKLLAHIQAPTIGVAYDCQLVPEIPAAPHDIPMTQVISERRIF